MLDRFFIHQINAPSSCCYLPKFCYRKETWGYPKVIHKKREQKRVEKKWTSVQDIENNGYSDARLKKRDN